MTECVCGLMRQEGGDGQEDRGRMRERGGSREEERGRRREGGGESYHWLSGQAL